MQNKSCLTIETNSSFFSDQQDISATQFDNQPDKDEIVEKQGKLLSDIHIASHRLSHSADHYIEELMLQMNSQKYKSPISRKHIVKIQAFYRMHSCKAKYAIRKKWARYRKFVLQELVDSEFTYIKDLESVIKNVYEPSQPILSESESKQLFRNLSQIYLLNKQFLVEISEKFNNFTQMSCFGKIFDKYVQFFKIYYEYTSNFSIEIVGKLKAQNKAFEAFMVEIDELDIFKGCNLESFLIKPVQRLPKYVLLLKDLIKHTWNTHPDFAQLQESLSKFIEVNCKIDMLMDNVLKNQMLFELQKQFFDQIGVSIVESTRKFVQSETLNILVSKQQKSVIVYICNDIIILTQRNQNTLIKAHEKLSDYLYLNEKSYCKNKQETQYCKFVFTVCSQEQSITFLCSDAEQKRKLISLFEQLIDNLKQKNQQHEQVFVPDSQSIRVYTKGTELRKTLFQSYTVYVMLVLIFQLQISSGSLNLTLSTRYSNLIKLEVELRKDFSDISIPHLSKNQWANNKKTQLIEARKIIIENFIEAVLNSPYVRLSPEKVLKFLELPPSFYEMVTSSPAKEPSIDRTSLRNLMKSSSFNCEDFSASETLRTVRGSNPLRQTMHHKSLKTSSDSSNIKIAFMDEFYIFLPISSELRVLDLIEMAADVIKLKSYEDFKLYYFDGLENRILDDDDCIPKLEQKFSNSGLIGKFQQLFKGKEKNNVQLLMKKYLYLGPKQERKDYQSDFVRLSLLSFQAFDEIKSFKFKLTFSQYCIYSVYFLIIKYYGHFRHIFTKQSLPMSLVIQLLPDKIVKQEKESTWIAEIFTGIGVVKQEIELLIKQHDNKLLGLKKQEQQSQYLAELLFMESISQNELYGLHLYNVEVPSQTKEIIQKYFQSQIEVYSQIGIKYDKLCLISKMEVIVQIPLRDISNPQTFPFSFQFQLTRNSDDTYMFKTTSGLEILKLFEIYFDISYNI